MTIKAALLDIHGVYLRIDELDDVSALTQHHLPHITECDLLPGKYRWLPDTSNPMGGAFWALTTLARIAESNKILAS